MELLKFLLLQFVIVLVQSEKIHVKFRDAVNPTKLLSNPQEEVLNSLSSVGIGNDVIERPAKKFLLHVYEQLQRGESLPDSAWGKKKRMRSADTLRSLTSQVPVYEGNGRVKLTFNLSSISSAEEANHAELHIRPLRHQQNKRHRFKVTVRGDQGRKGERQTIRVAAKSLSYYGYLVFDITDVIRNAMEQTVEDSTRIVDITVMHRVGKSHNDETSRSNGRSRRSNHALRSLFANPKNINEDDGLLVIYSQDKHFISDFNKHVSAAVRNLNAKQSRGKRDVTEQFKSRDSTRAQKRKNRLCARKDMWVDFQELGWNQWILYPPRYNAYMCGGRCPSPVDWAFDPTNHSILQSLLRLGDKKIKRPCCAPSKLGAISMLYYESDEIVVRHHEDMMVDSCGCR